MAGIKPSTDIVKLSDGTIGNLVIAYSKGKSLYARQKYVDRKVCPLQEAWREKYKIADDAWIKMPMEQRNAWRFFRWRRAWSNYAYYMHVNLLRLSAGDDIILEPPA